MTGVSGTASKPIILPRGLEWLRRRTFAHKYGVLDRLYGRGLARRGVSWVHCQNGAAWKLDLSNATHRWCVYHSIFTPKVATWMRRFIRAGGNIIDSGANIGQAALEFTHVQNCHVHCFEPLPEAADWLEAVRQALRLDNLSIARCGLYWIRTELELQIAGEGELHGAQSTLRQDWYADRGFKCIKVPLITLDEYAEERGLKDALLWKLDMEGVEEHALTGVARLLGNGGIRALYAEIANPGVSRVQEILAGFGYLRHSITPSFEAELHDAEITVAGDYLFMKAKESSMR